jgi:hypothetical protein
MSFKADLEFGHKYEDIFIEKILNNPVGLERPSGKFSGYDFAIGKERYEIKADRQTHKTGNFCIEFGCNGRPSGISVTQATHYGYFVVRPGGEYDIYKIPTSDILQMITDRLYSRDMRGGDGNKSQFFLFDKNIFAIYKVNGLPPVEESAPSVFVTENVPVSETSSSCEST